MDYLFNSNILNLFNHLVNQQSKNKNIILDPMSCLVKLALLSFYDKGTKISIHQNRIMFNEPGILQGTYRFFNGDGKEDLHNLFNPLQKSIDWYWEKDNDEINFLFKNSINGLKSLKKSYGDNFMIQHVIDYYITILDKKKKNKLSKSIFDNNENNKNNKHTSKNKEIYDNNSKNMLENNDLNETENKVINEIHCFLKNLWSENEVKIIIQLFKEFVDKKGDENYSKEEVDNFLSTIHNITKTKEDKLFNFITNHSTILE